ncbi:helix-turn-helix transcriptional regulator [Hoeflea sp. TYP-13]|uniref:helix-turn-helix transcriptional regulator n=1 Tax=Hoeflea sp. TYP-13 TaxID=3230023 RepID=UPI0034C6B16E
MLNDEVLYLNAQQASSLLGIAISTLAKWRLSGTGPEYAKLGRRIIYRRVDIDAWLARNSFRSTSEYDRKSSGDAE